MATATLGAITPEDWARIWAHALLTPNFKETLQRNPAAAVEWFQHQFPNPPLEFDGRLFDLGEIYLDGRDGFLERPIADLEEIAQKGTLGNARMVQPHELQIVLK